MIVYISMFFAIFLMRFLTKKADKNPRTSDKKFLIFAGMIIVFVMGSRNALSQVVKVGNDVNNYYRWYTEAPLMSWSACFDNEMVEAGYLLLNKALASIIPWPQFILYFEAAVVTFFSLRAIWKYSDNVFVGTICYLCMGNFLFALTGFRQAIAFSICLYAIDFLIKKKNIRFIIWVILAMQIHRTAVVFLPMVVLANWQLNKKNIFLMLVIMIVVSLSLEKVMEMGNNAFEREYSDGFTGNLTGGIINMLIYGLAVFLPIFNNYSVISKLEKKSTVLISIGIMGLGVYAMRFKSLIVERIALYFISVMPLLMSRGLTYMKVKNLNQKKMMQMLVCTLLILLFVYRVKSTIGMKYTFFWE